VGSGVNVVYRLAAVAGLWVTAAGAPRQGTAAPTSAERAVFRHSLVVVGKSGALHWHRLRGATGYEILSSRDGRRYRLEDLVTGDSYRPESASAGPIWFRVVALRSTKALADTTLPVRLDPHARGG